MSPQKKVLLVTAVLWLLVFEISFISPARSLANIMALLLNATITLLLVSLRPIRIFLTQLPRPHVTILVTFFFLVAAGQHLQGARRAIFFPFVQWDMFYHPEKTGDVVFYEYIGVSDDGNRYPLNPTRLFPPLRHARLTAALWYKVRAEGRGTDAASKPSVLDDAFIAIARAHNQKHVKKAIRAVEIIKCTMNLKDSPNPAVTREPIRWINLDGGVRR